MLLASDLSVLHRSLSRGLPSAGRVLNRLISHKKSPGSNPSVYGANSGATRAVSSMGAVRKADHSSFSNPEEVVVRHSHFGR